MVVCDWRFGLRGRSRRLSLRRRRPAFSGIFFWCDIFSYSRPTFLHPCSPLESSLVSVRFELLLRTGRIICAAVRFVKGPGGRSADIWLSGLARRVRLLYRSRDFAGYSVKGFACYGTN